MRRLVCGIVSLFCGWVAQAASHTNIASGNWTEPGSWNGSVGVGGADTVIVFDPGAVDNSTNDNAGAFWLNQLVVLPNQDVSL